VFIQHESTSGYLEFETDAWQLARGLHVEPTDLRIRKTTPDSFHRTELEQVLRDRGITDLVICGMASTDASGSVVPAMLAERLGMPQVTLASVVESQGDQVRIKRDNEGSTEVIGATLPIVLSVTDQSGEARYPSFKGIMAAKKKPLETWSLTDLGLDADQVGLSVAYTQVEDTTARPPRTAGEIVTDEDGSGAGALVEFLASKKFI